MPVEARAEGGCTGQGPGHGREACACPGERARDVVHDVAPPVPLVPLVPLVPQLVAATGEAAAR